MNYIRLNFGDIFRILVCKDEENKHRPCGEHSNWYFLDGIQERIWACVACYKENKKLLMKKRDMELRLCYHQRTENITLVEKFINENNEEAIDPKLGERTNDKRKGID